MPIANTSLDVSFRSLVSRTPAGSLVSASANHLIGKSLNWDNGTNANQADLIYQKSGSLATGATDSTIDLAGTLADATGGTTVFARVKLVMVASDSSNTTNLTIGAGSNAFIGFWGANTHTITIRPGGVFLVGSLDATSYTVTAGTADILQIVNSAGATATYQVLVVGSSA